MISTIAFAVLHRRTSSVFLHLCILHALAHLSCTPRPTTRCDLKPPCHKDNCHHIWSRNTSSVTTKYILTLTPDRAAPPTSNRLTESKSSSISPLTYVSSSVYIPATNTRILYVFQHTSFWSIQYNEIHNMHTSTPKPYEKTIWTFIQHETPPVHTLHHTIWLLRRPCSVEPLVRFGKTEKVIISFGVSLY